MADKGAYAYYMRVPFATGSATAAGFEGWVRLTEFSFDIKAYVSFLADLFDEEAEDDRTEVEFSTFKMKKRIDDASGELLLQALSADDGSQDECCIEVVVCAPDAGKGGRPKIYAHYFLEEAIIVGYSFDDSGGNPTEEIVVSYNEIRAEFMPHNAEVAGDAIVRVHHDLHE